MTIFMNVGVLPACNYTPDRNIELLWNIHNLSSEVSVGARNYELSGARGAEQYREMLIRLIERYWEFPKCKDVSTIYASDNLPYYVTGA